MPKIVLMILTFVFGISFGLHYFVVYRLSRIFELTYSWKILFVFLLITANFVAVGVLARAQWNSVVRGWWIGTVYYIGILWTLFVVLLVFWLIQLAVRFTIGPIPAAVAQRVVVVGALAVIAYSIVNARHIRVNTVTLRSAKVFRPITVVQLSDMHLGATAGVKYVERVVARTNALQPDLIAITGDLVDVGTTPGMLAGFKKLNAPAFFVWGNHDSFLGEQKVAEIFDDTPITILKNETARPLDGLCIVGLDFMYDGNHKDIKTILTELVPKDACFTLLLSHEPLGFAHMDGRPIDLQLAGHTHNGQIFPFNFIVRARYPHLNGLYTDGDRAIYVSPGTGTWGPPMRLGTKNEITRIQLLPKR